MASGKSYPRWGARAAAAAVFCLAGALAGTGLYFVNLAYVGPLSSTTCSNSGLTLVLRAAGECVGVTDGSYVFAPPLQKVEGMIEAENRRVRSTGPNYVSMAYLLPLSATGGAEPVKAETEQLEGAYAAQNYANRHNVQGTAPMIQLLVASSDANAAGYSTTDKIIEGDVAAQRLVAVAGIGISLGTTLAEVHDLTANGIPVIGSTITSDIFDNIPGLVRVAPSETQEINAALAYIKPITRTAMLISDANPADIYATTLAADFSRGFSDKTHFIGVPESYDTAGDINGSGPVAEATANQLSLMAPEICAAHPDVVLFAGRGQELAMLISDLESKPCSFPVTILTGNGAANMPNIPLVGRALRGKVMLDYAGEASPSQWDQPPAGSATKRSHLLSSNRDVKASASSAQRSPATSPGHLPVTATQ
jgi:hypothetical protein